MSRDAPDKYMYDDSGKLVGVLLEHARYRALLSALEELADVRAFNEAVGSDDEVLDY